jgi:hypothetical protein
MNEHLKQELIQLMEALRELAYGCMLQVGQDTATKVIVATGKVEEALRTNV